MVTSSWRHTDLEEQKVPVRVTVHARNDEKILKYSELYDSENIEFPIVTPKRIPIHPMVYNSRLYNADFCGKVLGQLETSIDYDLRTLRNKHGISLDFKGVNNFEATVDSENNIIEFGYDGLKMIISPGSDIERFLRNKKQLPQSLSYERAMKFSRISSGLEVPSWYAETKEVEEAFKDPTIRLTFRNAAILFNNLGISEAGHN